MNIDLTRLNNKGPLPHSKNPLSLYLRPVFWLLLVKQGI
jgi:hypothetical protein